jgi:hypothetical protein
MRISAFAAVVAALFATGAMAADRPEADTPRPPTAAPHGDTLKERLSDKASDQQRVDDCHVPPERRGPQKRPTDCPAPHPLAAASGSQPR